MKKNSAILLFFLITQMAVAQFHPSAGQPGTSAMHKDSTAFTAWATGCKILKGYQDISNPSLGYATLGDSTSVIGKANGINIVSLGDGGSAIVTFKAPITNKSGNDFAVFENSFNDSFLELAFVEVSSDGIHFFRFPATSNTPNTVQLDNAADMDARLMNNLAGKYRGSYGTPFDLQELSGIPSLNINNITHVKIVDVIGSIEQAYATLDKNGNKINDPWPTAFASSGFDLDAVGVIHQASVSVNEEVTAIQFHVFPNPITSSSVIQLNSHHAQSVRIDVLDLTGRQVAVIATKIQAQKETRISLGELTLKNGVYLVRVTTEHNSMSKKITIAND